MAIRTFVAAATLVVFTTPAFADKSESISILDDSVSTASFIQNNGALLVGFGFLAFALSKGNDGNTTTSTSAE